jgi:hypothetical protein
MRYRLMLSANSPIRATIGLAGSARASITVK